MKTLMLCMMLSSAALAAIVSSPPFVVPPMHSRDGSDLRPIYIEEMETADAALRASPAGLDPYERRCIWAEAGYAFARHIELIQYPEERLGKFHGTSSLRLDPLATARYREIEGAHVRFAEIARDACLKLDPKRYARSRQAVLADSTSWIEEGKTSGLLRGTVTDALLRAGRCGAIPGACGMSRMAPATARAVLRTSMLAIAGLVTLEAGELALPFAWPLPVTQ